MMFRERLPPSSSTRLLQMAVLFLFMLEWKISYANIISNPNKRPPFPGCYSEDRSCYPSEWGPNLKFSWPNNANITIQFEPPPAMTKFTRFDVSLERDGTILEKKQINTNYISYNLTCNGHYEFIIEPIDPQQHQAGNCSCYDYIQRCQWCKVTLKEFYFRYGENCPEPVKNGTKNGTENVTEVTSITLNVTTTPVTTSVLKVPSSNPPVVEENTSLPLVSQQKEKATLGDSKETTIIFISAGIVIAVILGLIVVYFMFKSKSSSSSGILQNYDNLVTEEEALTTKNVLLLFSNDHDFHYNVVNCLTSSLENDFKCHILYTPCITEKGILQWLHKMVEECDVVLLLHSESIKRQCDAWRVGKEYSQLRDDPNESTLMPILAHLQTCPKVQPYYSKFVSCHMKHLDEKYILHDFPSRDDFIIVSELKELVCRLHQLPPNSNLKKAFKIPLDNYNYTPKGKSLIQAIEPAVKYEENQNWFLDKYKCAEYCTESTADKCDCMSISITDYQNGGMDYQNGGMDYLKAPNDGRHNRCLPKPYFNDINSVSDISHCSTMLADINERNDRSFKNRNSFLETLPDDVHDLSM